MSSKIKLNKQQKLRNSHFIKIHAIGKKRQTKKNFIKRNSGKNRNDDDAKNANYMQVIITHKFIPNSKEK